MGSYLSVLNDAQDNADRYAKIGPDEAALGIASAVATSVGLIVTAAATAGATAPFFAGLAANGVVSVLGITTETLASFCAAAGSLTGVAYGVDATAAALGVTKLCMSNSGYDLIPAGGAKQYGKMSLSLWQQCVAYAVVVDPGNPNQLVCKLLNMRPIFSGATADSNNDHSIQWWIDKWGTQDSVIGVPVTNGLAKALPQSIGDIEKVWLTLPESFRPYTRLDIEKDGHLSRGPHVQLDAHKLFDVSHQADGRVAFSLANDATGPNKKWLSTKNGSLVLVELNRPTEAEKFKVELLRDMRVALEDGSKAFLLSYLLPVDENGNLL